MQTSEHTASDSTQTARSKRLPPKSREIARRAAAGSSAYFRKHGRNFPWRTESDPYRLAVAEILLQKTRAASVEAIYSIIVTRWSTANALSDAPTEVIEDLLLPLGLSRKRSIQLVGMASVASSLGPQIFDDWRTLLSDVPGLGAYAARAIACFGRGERVGIVDSNVARIIRRVFRIRTKDARAVTYQRHADELALTADDPREANFGLLDLGAAVCLPKPHCGRCPFDEFCPRYGVKIFAAH